VVYDGILTLAQYQQVEGYLATKWGFRNLLPQSHPGITSVLYPLSSKPLIFPLGYYTQFSPTSIAGCQIWLDAADSTTLFSDSAGTTLASLNGPIQNWKDKSGNTNNCTQSTTSNAPTYSRIVNNLPSLYIPNSNIQLLSQNNISLTNTSPKTLITVLYVPNTTVTVSVHFGGTSPLQAFMNGIETSLIWCPAMFNTDNYISPVPTNCIGVPALIYSTYTGTQANGYANFTNTATTTVTLQTTATPLYIGKRQDGHVSAGGSVCEILIYNTSLSDTQKSQIESYLAQKWGLSSLLSNLSVPTTIPGCQMWLDGTDPLGTGVAPANSASVSTWYDKSGYSRNATPSSGRIAGTFSSASNCVYFGSSSVGYQTSYSANPTNETMFIVASINSPVNIYNNTIIGGQYGARSFGFGYAGGAGGTGYSSYLNNEIAWQNSGVTGPSPGVTALITGTVTSTTNVAVSLNGSNFTTGTVPSWYSSTTTYLGVDTTTTQYYYVGYVMEILFYNSVLSTSQRQQVEGYLAYKWGLQNSLPVTHPYYASKPNHLNNTTPVGTPALTAQVYGQVQRNSFPLFPTTGTNYTSSTNGIYTVLTFAYPGGTLVVNRSITATYLVVGGGGGGGNSGYAGGGGAGGAVYISTPTVLSPGSYTVTVGAGGALGTNGGNSVFNGTTGTGGGYGSAGGSGGNGGCGGGGEGTSGSGGGTGSQGYNGSAGYTQYVGGGGGGGMGQAGSTSRSNVGNGASYVNGYGGGNGITNSITGSSVYYAGGGGGGGGISVSGGGPGGLGGGGNGAGWYAATQGTNGLGGGGGAGAIGGHGTVIISYLL
jgi:hypothetical protein